MDNEFIERYDNTVPQELCTELVKWFDFCSEQGYTIKNMPFADGKYKKSARADESIVYPNQGPVSHHSLPDQLQHAYWDILSECYKKYMEKYELNDFHLSCLAFKLHKVMEGEGYHVWHHEMHPQELMGSRVLAWMSYLKTPKEGGETEFLHQKLRIKPKVGTTLIWPAYFTHLHKGNMVLKGEKYYITGWFERL